MNILIASVVGALTATVVAVSGVNAVQGGGPQPVSNEKLYSYSDQ